MPILVLEIVPVGLFFKLSLAGPMLNDVILIPGTQHLNLVPLL